MNSHSFIGLAMLAALLSPPAHADEGHSHDAAPVAPSGPALPRFEATSENFELVGVVNDKELTVYLDRFQDNTPVKGATVDLSIGGAKVALHEHAEGELEGTLAEAPQVGHLPVSATVVAGNQSEQLVGELEVHGSAEAAHAHVHGWKEYAAWGLGALAIVALLGWFGRRVVVARRVGGAA